MAHMAADADTGSKSRSHGLALARDLDIIVRMESDTAAVNSCAQILALLASAPEARELSASLDQIARDLREACERLEAARHELFGLARTAAP